MDRIPPHLWFDRDVVEAAESYAATFPDSKVVDVTTIPDTPGGHTDIVTFELWVAHAGGAAVKQPYAPCLPSATRIAFT